MADVLKMIFECIHTVFDVLGSESLIVIAGVEVTLLDVLWGFFVVSMMFTFFLVPRAGSGLGGIRNVSSYIQSESRSHNNDKSKGDK